MSKSLEEIQAEIAAQNAAAPVAEAAPKLSVPELLAALAAATNIAPDVLATALDRAAPDTPELLPEGAKVFYTSFPNCGIMVQRGPASCERIEFKGTRLVTTDPQVIEYLLAIADKPGSTVYTKSNQHISDEVQEVRRDLMADANRAHSRMVAAGERVA